MWDITMPPAAWPPARKWIAGAYGSDRHQVVLVIRFVRVEADISDETLLICRTAPSAEYSLHVSTESYAMETGYGDSGTRVPCVLRTTRSGRVTRATA